MVQDSFKLYIPLPDNVTVNEKEVRNGTILVLVFGHIGTFPVNEVAVLLSSSISIDNIGRSVYWERLISAYWRIGKIWYRPVHCVLACNYFPTSLHLHMKKTSVLKYYIVHVLLLLLLAIQPPILVR